MKTLIILRHAKSEHPSPDTPDFDRRLNEKGIQDARHMASVFAGKQIIPDLIVSSPAVRAMATARIFASWLEYPDDAIGHDQNIYGADIDNLYAVIHGTDGKLDKLMIVAHNPGATSLLDDLTDAGIDNIPSCGLALIEFAETDWTKIRRNSGVLKYFDIPANYSI